jgi:hypothetical protein
MGEDEIMRPTSFIFLNRRKLGDVSTTGAKPSNLQSWAQKVDEFCFHGLQFFFSPANFA